MSALWRHFAYNYHEGGIMQVLRKALWRLQQWLWSEAEWLVYRLDVAACRQAALPLSQRLLAFETLHELGYFKALAFPEVIRARLDSGTRCHGFFLGGELVNIAWSTRDFLEMEPGVSLREAGCVGIFDCYTLPAHRSKGIYTDTLLLLARAAGDEGGNAALIAVEPANRPSIKGIERAGFDPLCRLTRLRRLGRQVVRRSEFRSAP